MLLKSIKLMIREELGGILRVNVFIKLTIWIVLFESIGFLLGLLTQANLYPWYEQLNKSALTPPGFVFSIVWTLIYGVLASIAWIISNSSQAFPKKITVFFGIQMLMNWLWTPLFFGLHWLIVSSLWLIGLTTLNGVLILEAKKRHKIIAWLLTPYILWLLFASYLNIVIALMN